MSTQAAPPESRPAHAESARGRDVGVAPLVALIAFVSFLPALWAGFVYDDTLLIAQNPQVQGYHGIAAAFSRHFWETTELGSRGVGLVYYRPLVTLSFVLNWLAFDGAAWGFHLVNLLLHAAAVFLAARLALRWLSQSWLVALIVVAFAVHPTRSESVIWIAGRTDLLMAVFALLSLELAHLARRGPRQLGYAALSLLAFAGTLLCKEGAVVLPALFLADALSDEPRGLSRVSRRLLAAATLLALTYLALRFSLLPVRTAHSALLPAYGFMTVATYAERLVFPWPQTFFYRNLVWGEHGVQYPWVAVAAGAVLVAAYLVGVWAAFRRDRAAAACLLAAVLLIAPVLNFVETGIHVSVSDHFLYLPLLLLLLGAARALQGPLGRIADRTLIAAMGVLVVVCAVPNSLRAADYKSDEALWTRELEINPDNPVALEWLSVERARSGDPIEAVRMLEHALGPLGRKHVLLSGPEGNGRRHLRRVVLTAAITPDGDARLLQLLYDELESYWRGKPTGRPASSGTLVLGKDNAQALLLRIATPRRRAELAAELATVASRLGRWQEARVWLRAASGFPFELLPNPLNLVLVQARVGDYAGARATLRGLQGNGQVAIEVDARAVQRLAARLTRAQGLEAAVQQAPNERKVVVEALSKLELGEFLVACRLLRPAYQQDPAQEEVAQLYAQALVSARLDADARRVITRALGPEGAEQVLAGLQRSLNPIQRQLPPAPDTNDW